MEGKQFKHYNGNTYTVLHVTNTEGDPERRKQHPPDVVYIGQNGKIWSRPLSDWGRSFSPADEGYVMDETGSNKIITVKKKIISEKNTTIKGAGKPDGFMGYCYKFRAECPLDAVMAINMIGAHALQFKCKVIEKGMPDCTVEVCTLLDFEGVRRELATVVDGHVMVQTLEYAHKYTGERDYRAPRNKNLIKRESDLAKIDRRSVVNMPPVVKGDLVGAEVRPMPSRNTVSTEIDFLRDLLKTKYLSKRYFCRRIEERLEKLT